MGNGAKKGKNGAIGNGAIGMSAGNRAMKVGGSKGDDKKTLWITLGVIAVVAVILVIVLVVMNIGRGDGANGGESGNGEDGVPAVHLGDLTEEEKEVTKKTMDETVEMEVGEYKIVEDEIGRHGSVPVTIKNSGDKKTSIAIDLVVKDSDGNILDQSSLYAEGIEPGQSQEFQTFVYSELGESVFKSSKVEVYRAYTYEAPSGDGTEEVVETVEDSQETPQE